MRTRHIQGHANRGMDFENLLESVHERYAQKKIAIIQKVPTEFIPLRGYDGKIVGCKVAKKSIVDYLGRYKNIPVAVEAKRVDADRITYNEVEKHQACFMDDFCWQGNAKGIVIVSFRLKDFYAIPWDYWREAYYAWNHRKDQSKRSCENRTVKWNGKEYVTNGKGGIDKDEIPKEWKIELAQELILPYLQVLDK